MIAVSDIVPANNAHTTGTGTCIIFSGSKNTDALDTITTERDTQPTKMAKKAKKNLFDEADSDSESIQDGNAEKQVSELKINEEYARRFEHNKKREERQRRTSC